MNTGQMLITIGAVFLLSLVILRTNTNLMVTRSVMDNSKVGLMAVSIATSTIEEASSKAFDAATLGGGITDPNALTQLADLGAETGENYPLFNDFDDFNVFRDTARVDSLEVSDGVFYIFNTFCSVDYVADNTPETPSLTRTFNKKLTVKVTGDPLWNESTGRPDTIKMSTIFSYWFYR